VTMTQNKRTSVARARRCTTAIHHSTVAMTIASALWLAESMGWLDALDVIMLRVVAPASQAVAADTNVPQVVVIDDEAYAEYFDTRSPLPRGPLVAHIEALLSTPVQLLVIDIQLEPIASDDSNKLDTLLIEAAARGTGIVLPIPEPRTVDRDASALLWMRGLCRKGIDFGDSRLRNHFGSIVRYDRSPHALAMVALARHPVAAIAQRAKPTFDSVSPCALAEFAPSLKEVNRPLGGVADRLTLADTAPIPPSALRQVLHRQILLRDGVVEQLRGLPEPRVVVLGGAYDRRDQFRTLVGEEEVSGAIVHAAVIGGHGKLNSSHLVAWLVDLGLGVLLGFLFACLWGLRVPIATKISNSCANAMPRWVSGLLVYYVGAGYSLFVWISPLLVTVLLFYVSGYLMDGGFWLNPGPLVIGMFLHAMLSDRPQHKHPRTLQRLIRHQPGILYFQVPFSVAVVSFGLFHAH